MSVKKASFALHLLGVSVAIASGAAMAGPSFEIGERTTVDTTLTVNYTASVRTGKPAKQYLESLNNDDGTRNFDRGSLITNRVSVFGEVLVRHDNLGAVLRGSHFHDEAYHGRNDNDSPSTVNKGGRNDTFTRDTRRDSGGRARLLDAYVYGNFDVLDGQYVSLKAGRHLVAWGESLFWPNISQGQAPVDATKFNVPGTEAKDAYLPVGQFSASWSLNEDLALLGFYQYEWEETQLNPVGDYFNSSDIFGPGAEYFRFAAGDPQFTALSYAGEEKPRDSGQWGLGMRYRLTDSTEVGLFHYRYHERVGALFFNFGGDTRYSSLSGSVAPGTFKLGYFEDVELTGVSFSSKIGDAVQFAGDLSYRDGSAVYLDNGTPARGEVWQANLNAMYLIGPTWLAHQTSLFGEVMHQHIESVDPVDITVDGVNIGSFDSFIYDGQTRGSTLLGLGAQMEYPSLFSGWDLVTKVNWQQNLDGSALQGIGRAEKRLTLGADFKYLGNFQVGVTYVDYLSSPSISQGRMMADRDYLSFNAKYSF